MQGGEPTVWGGECEFPQANANAAIKKYYTEDVQDIVDVSTFQHARRGDNGEPTVWGGECEFPQADANAAIKKYYTEDVQDIIDMSTTIIFEAYSHRRRITQFK